MTHSTACRHGATLIVIATFRFVPNVIAAIFSRQVCVIGIKRRWNALVLDETEVLDLGLVGVGPFMLQIFRFEVEMLLLGAR